jgi:hypothetical protein
MKNERNIYLPGGEFFGYVGDGEFMFRSWKDVWKAVTTINHPLAEYAGRVMSVRRFIHPHAFQRIRVSFDTTPPVVETVYPRWLGWGIIIMFGLVFWTGFFSAVLR